MSNKLSNQTVDTLKSIARQREITGFSTMKKDELIAAIESSGGNPIRKLDKKNFGWTHLTDLLLSTTEDVETQDELRKMIEKYEESIIIFIPQYTSDSALFYGNTKPHKEFFKSAGARFQLNTDYGAGWIVRGTMLGSFLSSLHHANIPYTYRV